MHGKVRGLSCIPNIYVNSSTSELRVGLVQWNRFKPSSKIILLTVPRRYYFCGSFVSFMSCVFRAFASVHCRIVFIFWESAVALHFFAVDVDWSAVLCDCGISRYYLLIFRNMNVAHELYMIFPTMWYVQSAKTLDQPAHTCVLNRAFASRLNILWLLSNWRYIIWSY